MLFLHIKQNLRNNIEAKLIFRKLEFNVFIRNHLKTKIYANLNLNFFLYTGSVVKEFSKSVHARYDLIPSFNLFLEAI